MTFLLGNVKCEICYPPNGLREPECIIYKNSGKKEVIDLDRRKYENVINMLVDLPNGVTIGEVERVQESIGFSEFKKHTWCEKYRMHYRFKFDVSEEYVRAELSRRSTLNVVHKAKTFDKGITEAEAFCDHLRIHRMDVIDDIVEKIAKILSEDASQVMWALNLKNIQVTQSGIRFVGGVWERLNPITYSSYGLEDLLPTQRYGLAICIADGLAKYKVNPNQKCILEVENRSGPVSGFDGHTRYTREGDVVISLFFTPEKKEEDEPKLLAW